MNSNIKRNKIIIQYTVVSLIAIITVAILLGFFISRIATDHLIRMHINIHRDAINQYIKNNPSLRLFIKSEYKDSQKNKKTIPESFLDIQNHPNVLRLIFWNSKNEIIWSNTNLNTGEKTRTDNEYQKALNKDIAYKIIKADKVLDPAWKETGWTLQFYIPVLEMNNVIGVIEMYELIEELQSAINKTIYTYWIIILSAGLVLYISLFFIFYKANHSQSEMMHKLEQTQDVTIYALAYQAELRDDETGRHLDRTASYTKILAEEIRKDKQHSRYFTDRYIMDLVKSAPLHDIGKVGIPDSILKKPGRLTTEEFEIMKKHCDYGVEVLKKASSKLSFQSFLDIAIQLTGNHHEKWNGSGYPKGLSGKAIHISGRIMALVDVYDALRSKRVYKDPFPHDRCVKIITDDSGKHFDPMVVEAFLKHEQEFLEISELLKDY